MTGPNDDKTDMNAAGTDNPSEHSDRPRRQMSDAQFEQLLGEALRVDVPKPGQRHAPTVPARRTASGSSMSTKWTRQSNFLKVLPNWVIEPP